jgi:AraC-like DNA-binding protein
LHCSCVPIRFDNRLVGVAKLVVDSETSEAAFSAATNILKLVVSETCQDSLVSVLSGEVAALRQCVALFQQVRSKGDPPHIGSEKPVGARGPDKAVVENGTLVERALAYLQQHYQEPKLSLPALAKTLGCNSTYLTTRFTQIVGEHMRLYLVGLRLDHACRLLMSPDLSIKEVAHASGFLSPVQLARAFRRGLGVSPREYRRIFAAR